MEFRVLGPLEVTDRDRRLALLTGRQGELLAYLLVRRDTVVSTDRLVEELWPSGAPPTAPKIVRNLVGELRKLLGEPHDGVALVTEGGGYRLRVSPEQIDATRFERLAAEGRRSLEAGDPKNAARLLREALALWSGPPFAGLADESFVRAERARLEELRLVCLEERIEADLALGRDAVLVAELESLVRSEPLRERTREQLMLALYRSGRQADALAVYREARRTLADELGLDPGRRLQELERAILAQDPSLDATTRTAVSSRRRGRSLVALGSVALLLAAAAIVLLSTRGDEVVGLTALAPNSVGAIDPDTGRIVAQVPLGAAAARLAASDDAVWALSTTERTLYRIDSRLRELTGSARLDDIVVDVAAVDDEVWVLHADNSGAAVVTHYAGDQPAPLRLDSLDPGTSLVGAGASFGVPDDRIAVGEETLWVTTSVVRPGGVVVLDRESGRIRARISGYVYGLAVGDDAAWLVAEQQLRRVDVHALSIDLELGLASPSIAIATAVGEGAVWVLSTPALRYYVGKTARYGPPLLTRVNPKTRSVAREIDVGGLPETLAVGYRSVWVTDPKRNAVLRVDPRLNRVADTIHLGARPVAVTVAGGLVWVSVI